MARKNAFPAITETDQAHLWKLSAAHREILALQDKSYDEIAAALQIKGGTVRSRLHRARAALQKIRDAQLKADAEAAPASPI